jgi:2-amino-4-hydroxy-6-hydroxymethyldihydropteridine diphosphokinase
MILKSVKTNHLNLPHPEVSNRNFVLLPLYEISKTWRHPKTKIKISKLINLLKVEDLMTIKQV